MKETQGCDQPENLAVIFSMPSAVWDTEPTTNPVSSPSPVIFSLAQNGLSLVHFANWSRNALYSIFVFFRHSIQSMVKHCIYKHVSLTSFIWNISTIFLCLLWHWHVWRSQPLPPPLYFNRRLPVMGLSEVPSWLVSKSVFSVGLLPILHRGGDVTGISSGGKREKFSRILPPSHVRQYPSSIWQPFPYCSTSYWHEMPQFRALWLSLL